MFRNLIYILTLLILGGGIAHGATYPLECVCVTCSGNEEVIMFLESLQSQLSSELPQLGACRILLENVVILLSMVIGIALGFVFIYGLKLR